MIIDTRCKHEDGQLRVKSEYLKKELKMQSVQIKTKENS